MKFSRFAELDKKLLIKLIAGILLLTTAVIFYLIKDHSSEQSEISISSKTDSSVESFENVSVATSDSIQISEIMVDVAGAVADPHVVSLPEGSRVFQAVEKAGGFTTEADLLVINQAEILSDGQKLYIPTKQEVADYKSSSSGSSETSGLSAAPPASYQIPTYMESSTGQSQSKININTADADALEQLTGVGPSTAEKIIAYRTENGRFKSIEEIKNVSGIGDKTFEKFKDQITV